MGIEGGAGLALAPEAEIDSWFLDRGVYSEVIEEAAARGRGGGGGGGRYDRPERTTSGIQLRSL